MPYADPEKQRRYQAEWMLRRRLEWIKAHGPCALCGSWDSPEVDHVERTSKVSHRIWSWSAARREEELAKCQVLCGRCHGEKTRVENSGDGYTHGTHSAYSARNGKGCRCPECTAAHAAYNRRQRETVG